MQARPATPADSAQDRADARLARMCGRYTYRLTWEQIVNLYRLTLPEEPPQRLGPNYNTAGAVDAWQVGNDVGNVRNNRPELMEPAGPAT
jgi:putative SOS response-associated peptidase YedK